VAAEFKSGAVQVGASLRIILDEIASAVAPVGANVAETRAGSASFAAAAKIEWLDALVGVGVGTTAGGDSRIGGWWAG
jgi:hypothetical protein